MTDKEIIKALECCASESIEDCQVCPYMFDTIYCDQMKLRADALDLINRQQEMLDAAIAGQETLQKALADKDREAAELNSDLKLLKNNHEHLKTIFDETVEKNKRLRDKVVGLTAEKDRLIETFGECQAEATKALAEKDKEIKRLNNNISAMAVTMHNCAKATRAEAIRAFAERLKTELSFGKYIQADQIDNLVKEMVGDTE